MHRSLILQAEPIDEARCVAARAASDTCGAVVYFAGVVRGLEGSACIEALDYEAYRDMAEHQFEQIFQQIEERWPVESVRLIHRIGHVPVRAPSLWIEIMAPHRAEALEACQFLIDEMKRTVPIWKHARPAAPSPPSKS